MVEDVSFCWRLLHSEPVSNDNLLILSHRYLFFTTCHCHSITGNVQNQQNSRQNLFHFSKSVCLCKSLIGGLQHNAFQPTIKIMSFFASSSQFSGDHQC